jgi:rubrerythrin
MQRAQQEETDLNTAASQALQQIGQKTQQQTVQDLIGLTREEKIADPASAPTVVEDEEKEDAPLGPVLEDAVELGPERARAKRYLPLTFAERRKRGRFTQLVQQEEPYRTPIQRFLM